jgi:hypothetical protein
MKQRESKIEWLETTDCTACWKAKREAAPASPLFTLRILSDPNRLQLVCTRDSFKIKDTLRARGYHFGEFTVSSGPVAVFNFLSGGEKGWAREFGIGTEQAYCDEIKWIDSMGYEKQGMDQAAQLPAAVLEGNPNLLPA